MGRRIMVVDDSDDVRAMTSLILRQAGYKVVEAINGKDALSRLDDEPVDAIVTDLNMPIMDGIDMVKGVRARSSIPIIMVTTVSSESKQEEGRAAGVTAWVFKPYRPNRLLAVVEEVLS